MKPQSVYNFSKSAVIALLALLILPGMFVSCGGGVDVGNMNRYRQDQVDPFGRFKRYEFIPNTWAQIGILPGWDEVVMVTDKDNDYNILEISNGSESVITGQGFDEPSYESLSDLKVFVKKEHPGDKITDAVLGEFDVIKVELANEESNQKGLYYFIAPNRDYVKMTYDLKIEENGIEDGEEMLDSLTSPKM